MFLVFMKIALKVSFILNENIIFQYVQHFKELSASSIFIKSQIAYGG